MKSRTVIVSRGFLLVNWKDRDLGQLYPETVRGLSILAEDISFETGIELDTIQSFLYDGRDLETLNDYLDRVGFELVSVWFNPELIIGGER